MTKPSVLGPTHTVSDAIHDITVSQKLVNGSQLLAIYYGLIFIFFLMDVIIQLRSLRKKKSVLNKFGPMRKSLLRIYNLYKKHGLITLNLIIWVICLIIILINIGFEVRLILAMTASVLIFTIFMKLALRIFINKESYEDDGTIRNINLICYILLGNFFCYYMSFISAPDMRISFTGLTIALLLCYYIMLHAIFNPQILQKSANNYLIYSQAFGIIKGMLAVLVCMLAVLYMMLYCCYASNPGFFAISNGETLDAWDLFYLLIISFTTIGYGDIVPFRLDGMFYSYYAAILIGISSLFTTTCFVAAVISAANSLAKSTRDRYNSIIQDSHPLLKKDDLTEDKVRSIIYEALDKYKLDKKATEDEDKKEPEVIKKE